MSETAGASVQVQLAQIQGGIDLMNERLLHASQVAEERHAAHAADIKDIRERQQRHSSRIGKLEAKDARSEGQRQGLSTAGRWAWALIGSVPAAAAGAAVMKLLGS